MGSWTASEIASDTLKPGEASFITSVHQACPSLLTVHDGNSDALDDDKGIYAEFSP